MNSHTKALSRTKTDAGTATLQGAGTLGDRSLPGAGTAVPQKKGIRTVTLGSLDVMPATPAGAGDEWATAKHYARMAEGGTQLVIVAQIMCGFELIELQKRCGIKKGSRTDLPNHSVSWPELVKQQIGRSDDTARNWMNMAKAVAPRLKKLDGPWEAPALLALPPSEWPEGAHEAISKTLKNVCDGDTQADWMAELGLIKKGDGRSKNPGGYRPHLEYLVPWLRQEYPDNPEYQKMLFGDLPEDVQVRFRKEGKRYMERLSTEAKEAIAREQACLAWLGNTPPLLNEALDHRMFDHDLITADDLIPLETALTDLLHAVRDHKKELSAAVGKLKLKGK
jgi:hypothetical protein